MDHKSVDSSNIESAAYEDGEMEVKFKSGKTYRFVSVPKEVFEAFMNADSKGKYFNQHIKAFYTYRT
jgi:hypothetical protein